MLRKLFILSGVVALLSASALATFAQKQNVPPIARAVYWANAEAEVYLLEKSTGGLRLTVFSKKTFTVTYHTRINSMEPVDTVLVPTSSANGVTIYDFNHNFTKMTIWMALEFTFDGQPVPELSRTFLNDIQDVVPNGYFNFLGKPKS